MGQFFAFVKKEFLYIFRDTWTMIILLVLPILMVILFGYGISTEIKNTHVAVLDPSRDRMTQQLVNDLSSSEYFIFDSYISDITQAHRLLSNGSVGLVVVFCGQFTESIFRNEASIQLITDASDPNTASTLTNYATAIINQSLATQLATKQAASAVQIIPEMRLLYNPTMKGAYNTVPGVLGVVMMLICTMMTAISIAREKETGSMEVLLASPVRPVTIILSKTVPYFALSMVNYASIMMLAYFVLNVPVMGSFALLTGVSMLFIFLSLSLGVLISIVASSQMVAMLISAIGMLMPAILLSGLMFPVENMPLLLRGLAQVVPVKWYIQAARTIMIQGGGWVAIAKELVVMGGMALLLLLLSLFRFNKRLE